MINVAQKVLDSPRELICDEAVNIPYNLKYDAVFANGVISYFPTEEYVSNALEIMYKKCLYSMGILSVHNLKTKNDFYNYRKQIDKNYEESYKDLPKYFYDKELFLRFAESHNLNMRFANSNMAGYWNNDFVFNVYMTKD